MIKAVIFDFDGTLADTIPAIREGVNRTMRRLGHPEHDLESVRSFINLGARHLIQCALPPHLQEDDAVIDHALSVFDECYGEVYLLTEKAYDGMKELVERLHGDYQIGILSNKQDIYVKQLSEQVLGAYNYDAAQGVVPNHPTKPHPYLSERIAAAIGVIPDECIMIGDSDIDLLTAQNANMVHVGVSWGYRSEEFLRSRGATRIAHTPEELEQIIRSIS